MIRKTMLLLLASAAVYAQDNVKLRNGIDLNVNILSNNAETIACESPHPGQPYYIVKNDIDQIRFGNGTVEDIQHPMPSLEEVKTRVLTLLNSYGLADESDQKISASFEGRLLRLLIPGEKSDSKNGSLFDLSKLYSYDEISIRKDQRAYINLWTNRVTDPEKKGKEGAHKAKLVIRANNMENAALMLDALKQLSKALKSS
ncbi:MAG TPA: hypothetical protein VGB50_12070 [Flavobacterium sp.]|jgi:hypothetical protein